MLPDIVVLGQPIHLWNAFLGLALAMAMWTASGRLATLGIAPTEIFHIGAISMIAGVLGAMLWGAIEYGWDSGQQVSFGGYLAGIGGVLLFVRIRGWDVMKVADVLAPSVLVGAAFGRLGCFLNGCCYGGQCAQSWAQQLPGLVAGHDGQVMPVPLNQFMQQLDLGRAGTQAMLHSRVFDALHPTQLYASVAAFAIYLLLDRIWLPRKRFDGEVTLAMLLLYGLARFAVEIPRVDTAPGPTGLVSAQVNALVLVIASLPVLVYNRCRAGEAGEGQ